MDVRGLRKLLEALEPGPAFIEHLGWSQPLKSAHAWQSMSVRGHALEQRAIAELGQAVALEVRSRDGIFPDASARELVHKEIAKRHPEHLIVFVDERRTKSSWCWVRRKQGAALLRSHVHLRGQPGGPLVEKVALLHSELGGQGHGQDEAVAEVALRLRAAMDSLPLVSRLTKDLQQQHALLLPHIQGGPDATARHAYAWLLLYRLLLLAFLQPKEQPTSALGHPTGLHLEVRERDLDYLSHGYMRALLFEGILRPTRSPPARLLATLERARQLSGGLFLSHDVEEAHPELDLPAAALDELLEFVGRYSWKLEAIPAWEGEVTPDVVDECFSRVLRPRQAGAYRAPPELARYLCEQTVHPIILEAIRRLTGIHFKSFEDLLLDLNAEVCRRLVHEVLPKLRFLDPACGSGTLLQEVMEALVAVHLAAIHHIEAEQDASLLAEVTQWRRARGGLGYFLRKQILIGNLFGVDQEEATAEAARSRLLLGLLSTAEQKTRLDVLPSLEFNILSGNALLGLTDTANEHSQQVAQTVRPLLESYRATQGDGDPEPLHDWIRGFRQKASVLLDDLLLEELWPRKVVRPLRREDVTALRPLHWCLDFGDVLEEHKGFDGILTFPPWEVLTRPSPLNDILRRAYPHSAQGAGRPSLYKFFIERAFHLLRPGGQAAMVVPASFYEEQGSSGLRRWLLEQSALRVVLGVSNEYHLFDEVHRQFKFCVLVFAKDRPAKSFEVAFRVDPRKALQHDELDAFLHDSASRLTLTEELVRRLSPASHSLPELQSREDLHISEKMMRSPLLETHDVPLARLELKTGLSLQVQRALHLHEQPPGPHGLLLCQGRMLQQYGLDTSAGPVWIDGEEAQAQGQPLEPTSHRGYRLALRTIARSTDRRTMTATVLPPHVLCDHSVLTETPTTLDPWARFSLVALLNSFALDYLVRQRLGGVRISRAVLMTLPLARLEATGPGLRSLALRAARLICTTPDFDGAAHEVGLRGHRDGAVEHVERTRLQAEIEGLVAHHYSLTEEEFTHILSTFPLVPAAQRTAAHHAYRDVTHGVIE